MTTAHQTLQDPLVVNGIQQLFTWILLVATPNRSWLRFVNVSALTAWMFWVYSSENLLSGTEYNENVLYRTLQGCVPLPLVMRTAAALFPPKGPGSGFLDMATAARLTIDPRAVNTPWQVRGIPSFPSYYKSRPPARVPFMLRQTVITIWQCLCLDLVFSQFRAWTSQRAFPASARELGPWDLPPGPWATSGASMLVIALIGRLGFDISYRLVSVVYAGMGVPTEDFPPLFGSIWDAYSLRNLWGNCWHQFMRLPFTATSNAITRHALRLPRSSVLGRYLTIAIVFFLSGLMHFLGAQAANIPFSGAMHFFGLSGLGLLIEITVQGLWDYFALPRPQGIWCKAIGFIWVGLCFSLVAPWYSPEWEYLFSVGAKSAWFLGAFTGKVGVPVAGVVVALSGIIVHKIFETIW